MKKISETPKVYRQKNQNLYTLLLMCSNLVHDVHKNNGIVDLQ